MTGWLAEPEDAAAWTDALGRSIDVGPEHRRRMGDAGMTRASKLYPVEAMCAATLAAYARVLEARGR